MMFSFNFRVIFLNIVISSESPVIQKKALQNEKTALFSDVLFKITIIFLDILIKIWSMIKNCLKNVAVIIVIQVNCQVFQCNFSAYILLK